MRDQQRSVDYLDFWYASIRFYTAQLTVQAGCCATHVTLPTLCTRTSQICDDWDAGPRKVSIQKIIGPSGESGGHASPTGWTIYVLN